MAVSKACDIKRAEERRNAVSGLFTVGAGGQTASERRQALNSAVRAFGAVGDG
jgi:hypothetical protein